MVYTMNVKRQFGCRGSVKKAKDTTEHFESMKGPSQRPWIAFGGLLVK